MEKQNEKKKDEMTSLEKGGRSFYCKVAVVGPSGTGKSFLSKTADINTTGYINIERKPLPYKQKEVFKHLGQPKNWTGFVKNITDYAENPEIEKLIIDSQTMALNILQKEMGQNFSGYDIYKNYNRKVYEYLEILKNIQKDVIVLAHDELIKLDDGGGKVKRMAVHGKEFEGKIEQHFTVVLYTGTKLENGRPQYFLKTFEVDTSTKVPQGLFSIDDNSETPLEIPNSAKFIFDHLEKYYTV